MEPGKVANYSTLFTLHVMWLMARGNISPRVTRCTFCCVWFLPRQPYMHIRLKKHSQNAKQLLTPPVLLKLKRFRPSLTTENSERESCSSLSTRDIFQMSWRLASHPPKMALAALQKQDKEVVI